MTPTDFQTTIAIWGALFSVILIVLAFAHIDDILWWIELHFYEVRHRFDRLVDSVKNAIVWALPDWVIYLAAIRLVAYATTGEYERTVVGEIRALTALKRWEKKL